MNTANHLLWGTTIGRTVGLPIEGAVVASIPDIVSVPLLAVSKYGLKNELVKSPLWMLRTYWFLHNWWVAVAVTIVLGTFSPKLGILGLGYFWHVIQDAFLHTDLATPFLWPVWKGQIRKYSAAHHWGIQVVDLGVIVVVNILLTLGKFHWG